MARQCLPNFFLVGAPKSGTTALYQYLAQHPAIHMSPIKEPTFFAPEVVELGSESRRAFERDAPALQDYLDGPMREKRDGGIVLEWEQYLKLFKHARAEVAIGEASVSYLGSLGAAQAIHDRVPDARILMMLRDPADRLFSHYASAYGLGITDRTFLEWIEDERVQEIGRRPPWGPIWAGRYGIHLHRYLKVFPAHQIHVDLYDEFISAPGQTLAGILTFLGVDPSWPFDFTRRHNVTLVPRWSLLQRRLRPFIRALRRVRPGLVTRLRHWTRVPLGHGPTADERARVIDLYGEDIGALQELMHRDLSRWLDPTADPRARAVR